MAKKIKTTPNNKLKTKFRFVILNDETFEEKFSLILTRTNVWVFFSISIFTLIFLTASAIIYTPLKYYIPGFGDYNYRGEILRLQIRTDSLAYQLQSREAWLSNLMDIASGRVDTSKPEPSGKTVTDKSAINLNEVTNLDKELRKEVEEEENFSLSAAAGDADGFVDEVKSMHLITPVAGYVTDQFKPSENHFGIDIAAKREQPVMAVLDGKIISANYSILDGNVITVQHSNNLISIYKHNQRLAKRAGDQVKSGEVIAFVGDKGENSTGPHLHFELWFNGKALNPRDYILF
jgi:murein DD-endopeptidase MepM/ murein hydrolase activator NlpD